jgi:hypothetical protein
MIYSPDLPTLHRLVNKLSAEGDYFLSEKFEQGSGFRVQPGRWPEKLPV